VPGAPRRALEEFTGYVPITTPLTGTVLAELIERLPTSGLTEPRGALYSPDWHRVDQVVGAVLGRL
jgi:mRNA-degrading endonuclease toxin of MazEF toxin-antitoxin module